MYGGLQEQAGETDAKGNFKRDLGKQVNGKPLRFYLGQNPEQAEQRMERLESLWSVIEAHAESPAAALSGLMALFKSARQLHEARIRCALSPTAAERQRGRLPNLRSFCRSACSAVYSDPDTTR